MLALLVIDTYGQPNLVITFSNMKCMTVFVVQSSTSATSDQCVKYSLVLIMHHAPIMCTGVMTGPTKSISHLSNISSTVTKKNDNSSLLQGFSILWQTSQWFQYPLTSSKTDGHQNLARNTFFVVPILVLCSPTIPLCTS